MREKSKIFLGFLTSEGGYILGMVLIFFLILTIIGMSFLTLGSHEGLLAVRHQEKSKRFYFAEGGVNKALWIINRVSSAQATFSDSSVSVVYDSVNRKLTSTSQKNNIIRTIEVIVIEDHPFRHIASYSNSLDIGQNAVVSHIDGADTTYFSTMPYPDMSYYQSIADSVVIGNTTFQDDTLYGIIYVDGEIKVHSGTVVYGSVIATGSVKFAGHSEIYAQQIPPGLPGYPNYYPALISSSVEPVEVIGTPTQIVYGTVYSSGLIDIRGGFLTGPLVADDVLVRNNSEISDLGSDVYYAFPPAFAFPPGYKADIVPECGTWTMVQ